MFGLNFLNYVSIESIWLCAFVCFISFLKIMWMILKSVTFRFLNVALSQYRRALLLLVFCF